MTNLKSYFNDGANENAQAVLCMLKYTICDGIESSWDDKFKVYSADVRVARWENYREQGYIVSLRNRKSKQLNIAFFEYRNSDELCAVKWEQSSLNSITIETAEFGGVYKDRHDVSISFSYNKGYDLAEWIKSELVNFWNEGENSK